MKQTTDGKFTIDYDYRYTQEDIPYGLVVMKGIAAIAGVATPNMDRVITWAQSVMGKLVKQVAKHVHIDVVKWEAYCIPLNHSVKHDSKIIVVLFSHSIMNTLSC